MNHLILMILILILKMYKMKKLKVMTVVGTRPEIIRLSRVLDELDKSNAIEHISINTGQNFDYELNDVFYKDLGIRKPDYFLSAAGKSTCETIGQILVKIEPILIQLKPDALLVLGDTNSCLSAITAKKHKIPIFHMEAGNRCFDQRVPEETNRKIVDHISDVNLTYSDIAREYLLREGLPADRIIKTGSPMFEVLSHYESNILNSNVLINLNLEKNKFFLVSAHREENISSEQNFNYLIETLNLIAKKFNFPVIVSTHPRTRNRLNTLKESKNIKLNPLIRWLKPLSFSDYNSLQINSNLVLSDSGTISEESSILNFKALNIRDAHERPEAMEEASVMMVGLKPENVLRGIAHLEGLTVDSVNDFINVADYSMPNVSKKIVRILLSYTEYINRTVWNNF